MTRPSLSLRLGAFFLLYGAAQTAAYAQTFRVLADLDLVTGTNPLYGALVQGLDGNFYGTASTSGAFGLGTVFKITPDGALTPVFSFGNQMADTPVAGLLEDRNGNLFGTLSESFLVGAGAVFAVTPQGNVSYLLAFDGTNGARPQCTLMQAADQSIYGTTTEGGASGAGEVFRITGEPSFQVLHSFAASGNEGGGPVAGVIQASDGNFYGTTSYGGPDNDGTVFKLTANGALTLLHSFNGSDGSQPYAALVQAADGDLYGTTTGFGSGGGTVFKITLAGDFTLLFSFGGAGLIVPNAALIQATDGNLYGTTEFGGTHGLGSIFRMTPAGTLMTVHSFIASEGAYPSSALVQATDGSFYGNTEGGSSNNPCCGTIFRLSMGLSPFVQTIPVAAEASSEVTILGTALKGATSVSFNGTPATFTVESATYIRAIVPVGASSGKLTVTTPGGTLSSNKSFRVLP